MPLGGKPLTKQFIVVIKKQITYYSGIKLKPVVSVIRYQFHHRGVSIEAITQSYQK